MTALILIDCCLKLCYAYNAMIVLRLLSYGLPLTMTLGAPVNLLIFAPPRALLGNSSCNSRLRMRPLRI